MTTPLTPSPMGESPARKKWITSTDGPAGVSPTKGGGSLPHKAIGESSPSKTVEREMSASAKDDSEKHEDAKASAQDWEGGKDNGSSQGEDKVDETEEEVTSEAPKRRKTLVAIEDRKEHILVAGKWAGLGAVWKVNEVCMNVSVTKLMAHTGLTIVSQGQLMYCAVICGPCAKGDKVCYGINRHPCSQCMRGKKTCCLVEVKSKRLFPTLISGVNLTLISQRKFQLQEVQPGNKTEASGEGEAGGDGT